MKGVATILLISLVVGIAMWTFLAQAQNPNRPEHLDDEWVCARGVATGFYYHDTTDLTTLQSGIWSIIKDPTLDDSQTYVYLTVFHTIQQVSHNIRANPETIPEAELETFWLRVLNKINVECEQLLMEQRFPSIN